MDPVTTVRMLFVSVAVLVTGAVILIAGRKAQQPKLTGLGRMAFYALIGYVVVVALSVTQAINPAEGFVTAARAALFAALVIFWTTLFTRHASAFDLISRVITLLAVALAMVGLCQYYDFAFTGYVPHAGLANRNLLASALCLMLPFVAYVATHRLGVWRAIALLAGPAAAAVVMLSNSRATWFAVIVAGAASVVVWMRWGKRARPPTAVQRSGRRGLVLFIVVTSVTAVLFATPYLRRADERSVVTRVTSTVDFKSGSVAERLAMWRHSLLMFRDRPWLGVGGGNWKLVSPGYGPASPRLKGGDLFFQRPHNDYLWVLSESGPFALGFYLVIWASALIGCLRTIRTAEKRSNAASDVTVLAGLVLYMTVAFFSYPMERITHTVLAALLIGAALSFTSRSVSDNGREGKGQSVAWIVVSMLLMIPAMLLGFTQLKSEIHIKRALEARTAGDWQVVIKEVDLALSRWVQVDYSATPLVWRRGIARYNLGEYEAACDDFKKALTVNPNHLHVLNNVGTCYEREGLHDSAEYYYRRALRIQPGFPETVVNLAATEYNEGRFEDALTTLTSIAGPERDERYNDYLKRIRSKLDSIAR